MRTLVAVDLDQTLIYSQQSIARAGRTTDGLICVELLDEAPQSFVTPTALAGLVQLHATTAFVPATTRTRAQYERIDLGGIRPRHAVVANGAEILVDGVPDPGWAARTEELLSTDALSPSAVARHLQDVLDPAWTKRILVAQDAFAMAVVERDRVPLWVIEQLHIWAADHGLGVSLQGRKFYVIPRWLSKGQLSRRCAAAPGPSGCCRPAIPCWTLVCWRWPTSRFVPRTENLRRRAGTHPACQSPRASGVMAGEEIVALLLAESLNAPPA